MFEARRLKVKDKGKAKHLKMHMTIPGREQDSEEHIQANIESISHFRCGKILNQGIKDGKWVLWCSDCEEIVGDFPPNLARKIH